MRRILIKRTNETEPAYLLRSFNHASEQVNRCYQLQAQRLADGNTGSALFYQGQARMWHRYMCEYRDQLANDFFPNTVVRIDEIFPGNDLWAREVFNKIPTRHPFADIELILPLPSSRPSLTGKINTGDPLPEDHPFVQFVGRMQRPVTGPGTSPFFDPDITDAITNNARRTMTLAMSSAYGRLRSEYVFEQGQPITDRNKRPVHGGYPDHKEQPGGRCYRFAVNTDDVFKQINLNKMIRRAIANGSLRV